ncbi:MAG: hypothetical protein ACI4JT_08320 [Oscillospiraceae bacterium]
MPIFRVRHPKNRKKPERPTLDGKTNKFERDFEKRGTSFSKSRIFGGSTPPKMPESAYISKCVPRKKQEANPSKFSDSMSENLPAFLENEVLQKRAIFRVRCPKNRPRLPQSNSNSKTRHKPRVQSRKTRPPIPQSSGVTAHAHFRRLDAAENAKVSQKSQLYLQCPREFSTKPVPFAKKSVNEQSGFTGRSKTFAKIRVLEKSVAAGQSPNAKSPRQRQGAARYK